MFRTAKLAIFRRLAKASVAYYSWLCSITYQKQRKAATTEDNGSSENKLRYWVELQFIFEAEVVEGLEIFAHPFLLAAACSHRRYRVAACLCLRIGGEERIDLAHAQPHHQAKHNIGTGHLL